MTNKWGPIYLADGVTKRAVWVFVLAVCIVNGLDAVFTFSQSRFFEELLQVARASQSRLAAAIQAMGAFLVGLAAIVLSVLSDRIGRRRIIVGAFCIAGAAFVAIPTSTTITQFVILRAVVALGEGAATAMALILLHDYVQEQSRGKLVAVWILAGALGAAPLRMAAASVPRMLETLELQFVTINYVMFWSMAFLCLVVAGVSWRGLQDVTNTPRATTPRYGQLISQLVTANRNSRQWVSYGANGVAIFSTTISGIFLSLWAIQDESFRDLGPAEAMAAFGIVVLIAQLARFIWLPAAAYIIDRTNGLAVLIAAAGVNALGFALISLLDSPLSVWAYPIVALAGIGTVSLLLAAVTLAGQEAPAASRGAILGGFALCGSVSSLVAGYSGGRAFDYDPTLPFALAAFANLLLLVFAAIVYRKSGAPLRLNFEQDESIQR